MKKLSKSIQAFMADEHGATAIEYGLLASLIGVAIIASVGLVGGALNTVFTNVVNALT